MKNTFIFYKNQKWIDSFLKLQFLATITMLAGPEASAQSGAGGIQAATSEVKSYFQVGTTLMYAIGAIVGLVGAIKVYNKWNSGDNDTGKVAASWFGSCIFLVVVATVLKGFFGV
ncbi:DUF4134 domain-containing protein [Niabella sp.]|uniref:DUF4134 domain-containing protein n=1 Tax=Niabella sp. TaxID=1962976 RepID=UPI002626762C|nr:DUF4134 domain-containing protein [Niabella sp.]